MAKLIARAEDSYATDHGAAGARDGQMPEDSAGIDRASCSWLMVRMAPGSWLDTVTFPPSFGRGGEEKIGEGSSNSEATGMKRR